MVGSEDEGGGSCVGWGVVGQLQACDCGCHVGSRSTSQLQRCSRGLPTGLPAWLQVSAVAKLGVAVLATCATCWAPWLLAPAPKSGGPHGAAALDVLQRVFPTQRGLYEDYVANWWCASSRALKWARLLSQPSLVLLCAATTLAAAAPAMVLQVLRPSPRGFLLCLANSAAAFFLFSYQVCEGTLTHAVLPVTVLAAEQHRAFFDPRVHLCLQVHEKSILLPLLPLSMLFGGEQPQLLCWIYSMATFSMLPLLKKDGLALATAAAVAACNAAIELAAAPAAAGGKGRRGGKSSNGALRTAGWWQRIGLMMSLTGCAAIVAAAAALPPPAHLPFLYDALVVTWSFVHFAALFVYTNFLQLREYHAAGAKVKQV